MSDEWFYDYIERVKERMFDDWLDAATGLVSMHERQADNIVFWAGHAAGLRDAAEEFRHNTKHLDTEELKNKYTT